MNINLRLLLLLNLLCQKIEKSVSLYPLFAFDLWVFGGSARFVLEGSIGMLEDD
jgi:hypothetical protein